MRLKCEFQQVHAPNLPACQRVEIEQWTENVLLLKKDVKPTAHEERETSLGIFPRALKARRKSCQPPKPRHPCDRLKLSPEKDQARRERSLDHYTREAFVICLRHHIRIRPKKSFAVEVNQVIGIFGDPHLFLPGDLPQETLHRTPCLKRGREHQPSLAVFEKFLQFIAAFPIHRASARDGFDQQQPLAFRVMHDNIGHLRRWRDDDAQSFEICRFKMQEFALGIVDVNDRRARCKARTELLDD